MTDVLLLQGELSRLSRVAVARLEVRGDNLEVSTGAATSDPSTSVSCMCFVTDLGMTLPRAAHDCAPTYPSPEFADPPKHIPLGARTSGGTPLALDRCAQGVAEAWAPQRGALEPNPRKPACSLWWDPACDAPDAVAWSCVCRAKFPCLAVVSVERGILRNGLFLGAKRLRQLSETLGPNAWMALNMMVMRSSGIVSVAAIHNC